MALPFFYIPAYNDEQQLTLDEDTSRHVVQVLRMQNGEQLQLTDGKGSLLTCKITDSNKKHCSVAVSETKNEKLRTRKVSIAISLLKNSNRLEWFLEKATEIGVSEIIPLICERTEKEKFRYERMQGICISAMLQSQQCWLPVLHEPKKFDDSLKDIDTKLNMIAHCQEGEKMTIPKLLTKHPASSISIFIGPEGDFTKDEIDYANSMQCFYVALGQTRLRTETAGVVAATLLCQI